MHLCSAGRRVVNRRTRRGGTRLTVGGARLDERSLSPAQPSHVRNSNSRGVAVAEGRGLGSTGKSTTCEPRQAGMPDQGLSMIVPDRIHSICSSRARALAKSNRKLPAWVPYRLLAIYDQACPRFR
uniref:Uncharacterized protein n=1 Tax=Plectus sambesii TaxID=2011161 RepID=A0A914UM89_9BILA